MLRPSLGPAYRGLWTASGLSNLADGILQLSLPLLALELGSSPSAVAGITVALGLPWLLFALHAGALADRLDRRRVMVAVQLGRVIVVGGLAVVAATATARTWMLFVVAFALGVMETLFDTSAQTIVPTVVAADELTRANGRLSAVETTMNEFVGPPLGGLLVGVGVALSLGTTAACFLLAAIALARISGSFRPTRIVTGARWREDIAEGLRYLRGQPVLCRFTLIGAVSNVCATAAFALLAVLVVAPGPMGLSELEFGALLTVSAVGSLIASLTVEAAERALGRRRLLLVCIIVDGASIAAMATADVAVAIPASLVLGAGLVVWNVIVVSLRQRIVPDHLLGRVNAASRMVSWGAVPVGAAIGATLVGVVDVTTVFAYSGVAIALLSVLLLGITDDALDGSARDAPSSAVA